MMFLDQISNLRIVWLHNPLPVKKKIIFLYHLDNLLFHTHTSRKNSEETMKAWSWMLPLRVINWVLQSPVFCFVSYILFGGFALSCLVVVSHSGNESLIVLWF